MKKKYSILSLSVLYLVGFTASSCKKEYKRPDEYTVDLFNKKDTMLTYQLSKDEAESKSKVVLQTNRITLEDSAKIKGRTLFVYQIDSANIIKDEKDSISAVFPMRILSDYDLKVKPKQEDTITIYLQDPVSYKLFIQQLQVQYQAVPYAPTSSK